MLSTRAQAMEHEIFMKTGKGRSFLKEVINTVKRTVK